jgi:hypothetical protein
MKITEIENGVDLESVAVRVFEERLARGLGRVGLA